MLKNDNGSPAITIKQARDSYIRLKVKTADQSVIVDTSIPTLNEFASEYLQSPTTMSKSQRTVEKESQCLGIWKALFGQRKLDRIDTSTIREFIESRLAGRRINEKYYPPISPRTSVIDLIVIRNLLKTAMDAGHIQCLPRFPKIKVPPPPRRELVSDENFKKIVSGCSKKKTNGEWVSQNGPQLADLLLLLDLCGARETEAYGLAWNHVDFTGKKLWLGVGPDFDASTASVGTGGGSATIRL